MDELPINSELFADGNRGIYIPQYFAESVVREKVSGVSAEQWEILESGPDHESYWDVWDEVERDAILTKDDGTQFCLHQDGDLWIVQID